MDGKGSGGEGRIDQVSVRRRWWMLLSVAGWLELGPMGSQMGNCQVFRYLAVCEWGKCGEGGGKRLRACTRMAVQGTFKLLIELAAQSFNFLSEKRGF